MRAAFWVETGAGLLPAFAGLRTSSYRGFRQRKAAVLFLRRAICKPLAWVPAMLVEKKNDYPCHLCVSALACHTEVHCNLPCGCGSDAVKQVHARHSMRTD